MTHGQADIRELLAANGLRPSRALGQNFVADANTVRRVARLSGVGPGRPVVEVGAGLGSLTLALAETGASVTAVEVDPRLVAILRPQVEPLGVRAVEGDALTLDWHALLESRAEPWFLVANLPYNVAVPLVVRVLEHAPAVSSMLVMVQRELGERMAAVPGHKSYGALSVKVAYWSTAVLVGRVPASVFVPKPRVESVLVRLERRPAAASGPVGEAPAGHRTAGPGAPAYDRLFAVVRAGFAHRRKMLRRSLDGVVAPGAFDEAGIAPTARAEELDLEAWARLAAWKPSRSEPSRPGPAHGPAPPVRRGPP
jgi:16S rRNA (adenine1518-N6/adenine1519-N6)-dimethyltransferase